MEEDGDKNYQILISNQQSWNLIVYLIITEITQTLNNMTTTEEGIMIEVSNRIDNI